MTHPRHTMRRTALSRWLLCVAAAALAGGVALAAAPAAQARVHSVSPGDEIDVKHGRTGSRCTLGYTFTDPTSRITYGITAGHCNDGNHSPVIDRTTGATGRFVYSEATPSEPLYADFGLIDFGTSRSVRLMYHQPVGTIAAIDPTKPVCHDGIRTGIACGQYAGRLIADQYLTSGMPKSIPGDSGGPVWQPSRNGSATIVGIWLGQHVDQDGAFGRFTSLTDVLPTISAQAKTRVL
jgi:streptogrisin B